MKVFTYADQREVMGRDYDLIPHKTAACRNFAFYYVYKHTDHDLIITIDDDCLLPPDFMASYALDRHLGRVAERHGGRLVQHHRVPRRHRQGRAYALSARLPLLAPLSRRDGAPGGARAVSSA